MSDLDEAEELLQEAREEERAEAKRFLGMGLGVGAVGAASAVAFGAVCPVCVVAAPALLAIGVAKHVRARRRAEPRREFPARRAATDGT